MIPSEQQGGRGGDAVELPGSVECEQALLGTLVIHPEWLDDMAWLTPPDFFWKAHQQIFHALHTLHAKGERVHALRLGSALNGDPAFEEIEETAAHYVNRIVVDCGDLFRRGAISSAHEISRLAKQRQIFHAATTIASDALSLPASDTIEDMQSRALEALEGIDVKRETPDRVIGASSGAALESAFSPKKATAHTILSGCTTLDTRMGGMKPGEMIVPAGRPGMGKSLFAQRVARTAVEQGYWVLFVQLEMGEEQMAARFLTDVARDYGARVFYSNFRSGKVKPEYAAALGKAEQDMKDWPLFVEPTPGLTMAQIASKSRQIRKAAKKAGRRLGLVIIDHIGLVQASASYRGNKVSETTEVSNACKRLAKELDCVVIALCQLNRAVEHREEKRPVLSDLRESGSIEQDADAVLLLYREAYYLKQREATTAPAEYKIEMQACEFNLEINCAKLRDGDPGIDRVACDAASASIRDEGAFD